MRLQTSITLQNTKQWQFKMLIHRLEVGEKSVIMDGQNVDLQLAGGGGGSYVNLLVLSVIIVLFYMSLVLAR